MERTSASSFSREKLSQYLLLMRVDRPIGIYLLLWPVLWALWIAAKGLPDGALLLIFMAGTFLMRSAGCVINDFADRKIDGHVKRTQSRPLVSGLVTVREALGLFIFLVTLAFLLVLMTNAATVYLSFGGLLLAASYPFMKRYTYLPQVVLGAAFAWAIPMAFTAQTGGTEKITWLLYSATVLWTVAYDTMYAMVDRDDDLKIGVKSTAILFGDMDRAAIATLQVMVIIMLFLAGEQAGLGRLFHISLVITACLFIYEHHLIQFRRREDCFRAFLHNNWVGMAVFLGIAGDFFFQQL